MTSVIYPGTFDPITNGHLDIIARSAVIFPKVFVAVANSPSKKPLFSLEERVELVRQSVAHLSNVEVFGFSDLLANEIKTKKIDFEYELQLAALNRLLTDGVDSLFFPPTEKWAFVSSTIVREIYLHHGNVKELVPEAVYLALQARRE